MTAVAIEQQLQHGTVVHHHKSDWDQVATELGAAPFQSWAWGELKALFGWQPIRLSTSDGSSAAQLLVRPFRGLAVAYVPRGPATRDGGAPDPALIRSMIAIARSRRAAFLRIEPDVLEDAPGADALSTALRKTGFQTAERTLQPRSSIRMDVRVTDEELMRSFSKGHRASVRRAERDGVAVRIGANEEDVDLLHAMVAATQQRKMFVVHSPAYYRALWRLFGEDARLFIAEHNGEVVAATLCLTYGRHGAYLVAGSTRAGLDLNASHLMQWHAIRWARERGVESWDLWGLADARGRFELAVERGEDPSSPEMQRLEAAARSDSLDGVYRFKKGWGGRVTRTLPAFDRVFIRPAYWFWQWRRGEA